MKMFVIAWIALISSAINMMQAQTKFKVNDLGNFKLHSYTTQDPLGDMNYIIEGMNSLVILEPIAFYDNISEFKNYVNKLNKPIEKIIADYHIAGFSSFDQSKYVAVKDMVQFAKGDIYSGMLNGFSEEFKNKMDMSEYIPTTTVNRSSNENWAGVTFKFLPGASSDFPASSILIGNKVYYSHFTPKKNMHMSALQITGRHVVDPIIKELEQAKKSGATMFIGGHGVSVNNIDDVDFQLSYMKKIKETMTQINTADEFVLVMQMIYKDIDGEDNLTAVANNLYK